MKKKQGRKHLRGLLSWLLVFAMLAGEAATPLAVQAAEETPIVDEDDAAITNIEGDTEEGAETTEDADGLEENADATDENEAAAEDEEEGAEDEAAEDVDASENADDYTGNEGTEEENASAAEEASDELPDISDPDGAASYYDVKIKVKYDQSSARSLMSKINDIRNEAKQPALNLDYGLEKVAIERVPETVLRDSDVRPNGENYNTLLSEAVRKGNYKELRYSDPDSVDNMYASISGNSTITSSSYTNVAVGHVTHDGTHYWVILLTNTAYNVGKGDAKNSEETVTVKVNQSGVITDYDFDLSVDTSTKKKTQIDLEYYDKTLKAAPKFTGMIKISSRWTKIENAPNVNWTLTPDDIAAITDNNSAKTQKIEVKAVSGNCAAKAVVTQINGATKSYEYTFHVVVHPTGVEFIGISGDQSWELDTRQEIRARVIPAYADTTGVTIKSGDTGKATYGGERVEEVDGEKITVGTIELISVGDVSFTVEPKDTYMREKVSKNEYPLKASFKATVYYNNEVKKPVVTFTSGKENAVYKNDLVCMSCDTPGAEIYYWLTKDEDAEDNADFDREDTHRYTAPFSISEDDLNEDGYVSLTVQARKVMNGELVYSEVWTEFIEYLDTEWGDIEEYEADMEQWDNDPNTVPDELWWAEATIPTDYVYDGKAKKPAGIRIYDFTELLTEKKDYTLSYENNTNAGTAYIKVTFKGNYSGTIKIPFDIAPCDLEEAGAAATAATQLLKAGKTIVPKPVVKCNKKTLRLNTDYSFEEKNKESYSTAKEYTLVISGTRNYTGSIECSFVVAPVTHDLSKAKLSSIPAQAWDAWAASERSSAADLKDKKGAKLAFSVRLNGEKVDLASEHYKTEIIGGNEPGSAVLRVSPADGEDGKDYAGSKDVTFKINGNAINKLAKADAIAAQPYNGSNYEPEPVVKLKSNGKALTEGSDYTLSYKNQNKAGTAKVTISGIASAGWTGSITVSYKITKFDLSKLNVSYANGVIIPYTKGGAKQNPDDLTFYAGDLDTGIHYDLVYGTDYTISYKNNTKLWTSEDGVNIKKMPGFTIKGKGNYTGSIADKTFYIVQQDLKNLTAAATDIEYTGKAGIYTKTKLVVKDPLSGKTLKAGTDYKIVAYRYNESYNGHPAGSTIGNKDLIPAGVSLHVAIHPVDKKGKSNYTGSLTVPYKVTQMDLSKAKASIANQTYTGYAINLDNKDIKLTYKGVAVSDDSKASAFDILSYTNNVNVGTAAVTIRGKGNYGGTVTIKFKIVKAQAAWYEKKENEED